MCLYKSKDLKQREKKHLYHSIEITGWDEEKASLLLKIPLAQVEQKIRENATQKPNVKEPSNH